MNDSGKADTRAGMAGRSVWPVHDARRYLLPRPPFELSLAVQQEIDRLLAIARANPEIVWIEFDAIPKWQLLCDLADRHGLLLHGTGDPNIAEFVPRQPKDSNPFGAQNAVYAASDGIWPMFYAVLDRNPPFSLHNGCIRLLDEGNGQSDPLYYFSIEKSARARRPFRAGYVYLLPSESFSQDPQTELAGLRLTVAHWASLHAVRPIAIVPIEASDFPFLEQIRGHDDETLSHRIRTDRNRFPWVDEQYA